MSKFRRRIEADVGMNWLVHGRKLQFSDTISDGTNDTATGDARVLIVRVYEDV